MPLVNLIETIARATTEAMLNGLWQGMLVVALVWCLFKAIPRLNATTRYAIWWVTLIAVICLPIAAARGYYLASEPEAASGEIAEIALSSEAPSAANGISSGEPVEAVSMNQASEQARQDQIDSAAPFFPVRLPGRWAIFLFAAWALIVLVMLARIVWSYCYLMRVKRNCSPLVRSHPEGLKRQLARTRLKRRFELRSSVETSVPMVIGLMEPVIVIPQALARELTEEEFEQVALHELAHVRRWDDWMKLLQRLVEAFLFFHPAVLWIGRQLNLEREVACDDSVISMTGKPRPYAACLVKLLELTTSRQHSLLAPGAVTIKRQISSRVEMIVDKRRNATLTLSKAGLFIMLVALALVVAQSAYIAPALALTEPVASSEPSRHFYARPIADDAIYLNELAAATSHNSPPLAHGAISANPAIPDSLNRDEDKPSDSEVETGATELASFRPVKHAQGSLPEPPVPPSPPRPPAMPPVPPSPPTSVPAPPSLPSDRSQESRAGYDRAMADYNQAVSKYREQLREYDRDLEKYREGMREYDRQVDQYKKATERYNEEVEQYRKEMKEFEKRIHALVPGAILNVIAEQIAALDIKLDADARDKLDRGLRQIAAALAPELIEKYKDLKIHRPAGRIILVSFLSTTTLRNRLRELFASFDSDWDQTTKASFDLVADRAAPALQSLIVYRWP